MLCTNMLKYTAKGFKRIYKRDRKRNKRKTKGIPRYL